jgi:hypothetical protein
MVDEKSVRGVAKDLNLNKKPRRIWFWFVLNLWIAACALLFVYLKKSGYLLTLYKEVFRGFQYIKEILNKGVSAFSNFL